MGSERSEYWVGFKTVAPLLLGIFPFAMVAGTTAMAENLSIWAAMGLSTVVFAGASQLAIIDLIGKGAPIFIILITAWVINLRFMIYSAGLAPYLKGRGGFLKASVAYLLTDQAYLLGVQRFETEKERNRSLWFYFGVASALWIVWQLGTAAGILLGRNAPESLGLDFAVPLSFIALMMPTLKNKPTVAAGLVSAVTVYFASDLPLKLGFLVAVAAGITTGLILARRS